MASRAGVDHLDIEVVCSDPRDHRARVETRRATIDGLRLPTWAEVTAREYHAWTVDRVVVDTAARSEQACMDELLSKLPGGAAAATR